MPGLANSGVTRVSKTPKFTPRFTLSDLGSTNPRFTFRLKNWAIDSHFWSRTDVCQSVADLGVVHPVLVLNVKLLLAHLLNDSTSVHRCSGLESIVLISTWSRVFRLTYITDYVRLSCPTCNALLVAIMLSAFSSKFVIHTFFLLRHRAAAALQHHVASTSTPAV